jgi:NAD-specific glutamate dehydrogenase
MRNEVLQRIKEETNILQTIKRRMVNWIGHILRTNCFLKEGKIKGRIE